MSLLEVMEDGFETEKRIKEIEILHYELELNNNECVFADLELKLGVVLSDGLKKIYSKYKKIKLVWEMQQTKERGYFELIPFNNLYSYHRELVGITELFMDDNSIENANFITEDIRNWIPVITFPNGDAFCIDIRNNKIVFFEHDVFDTGANLHGLVIAENIDRLTNDA